MFDSLTAHHFIPVDPSEQIGQVRVMNDGHPDFNVRPLDREIHLKIFGRKSYCVNDRLLDEATGKQKADGHFQLSNGKQVPHYSTKIKDAWEVVEKLVELGYPELEIAHYRGKVEAQFIGGPLPDGQHAMHSANAATAPMAICQAALKTSG